jgi:hypothetical protein
VRWTNGWPSAQIPGRPCRISLSSSYPSRLPSRRSRVLPSTSPPGTGRTQGGWRRPARSMVDSLRTRMTTRQPSRPTTDRLAPIGAGCTLPGLTGLTRVARCSSVVAPTGARPGPPLSCSHDKAIIGVRPSQLPSMARSRSPGRDGNPSGSLSRSLAVRTSPRQSRLEAVRRRCRPVFRVIDSLQEYGVSRPSWGILST